jgi:hypothetical protein
LATLIEPGLLSHHLLAAACFFSSVLLGGQFGTVTVLNLSGLVTPAPVGFGSGPDFGFCSMLTLGHLLSMLATLGEGSSSSGFLCGAFLCIFPAPLLLTHGFSVNEFLVLGFLFLRTHENAFTATTT